MLDDAGLEDCKIMASNSLDEYTIKSLLLQGGPIDIFGVGERLITSKVILYLALYIRLQALRKMVKWEPRIKISEAVEKLQIQVLKGVPRIQ